MHASEPTATLPLAGPEPDQLDRVFPAGGALDGRLFSRLIDDRPDELAPGTRLGSWRLDRPLGRGGSATVYLAEREDRCTRLQAALKVVRAGRVLVEQCRREREILGALDHPSIVGLIDGDDIEGGRSWLAMEPVFGERIDVHVQARRLELAERLALFEQICDAVAHVHSRRLIHCDIKPGNLLVDGSGRPRLLDFGIAVAEGVRRPSRHLAMTPIYASPEQRAGNTLTSASDIYQLGALLDTLIDAEPDIDGNAVPTRPGTRRKRATRVDEIIRCATARDPTHRFPSVEALSAEVAKLRRRDRARP